MHHPDPYAADKPLLTISATDADKYADKLTAGQKAMLKLYPSYKMKVYPTHRSAAAPQRFYDATKNAAVKAQLTTGGNGVTGVTAGTPFPIPKSGTEVDLEPPAALARQLLRAQLRRRPADPRRRLHPGSSSRKSAISATTRKG